MKKPIIIIVILLLAALAMFVWDREQAIAPNPAIVNIDETIATTPEAVVAPAPQDPKPVSKYSYTNSEFGFAVDLPGLVATRKTDNPYFMSAVFTFGVGDQANIDEQKRIPNTMALYIWNNKAEFENMIYEAESLGKETINGKTYDVYSFTLEDSTTYHYTRTVGELIYDIGVRSKADAKKFYFI